MNTAARILSNRQIARAAVVLLFGFITSGVLGLIRTAIFSATFGTSEALDAFYAAQRIPEALFVLVAGGALGSSFIPVFARFLASGDTAGAWRLASAVMSVSATLAAVLAVLVTLAAPVIVPMFLVPLKPPEVQALTVTLTQTMMVTVVIFSISGLLMGILNANQIFTLPALALSMNNIGLIFGAVVLARWLPPVSGPGQAHDANIYGLAIGAVIGAALHMLIQIPGLRRLEARLRFLPDPRIPGVRDVILLMGPRVLGLAVVQINFIVNSALASGMVEGSYTALTTAWTLMFFALGIIGQSIGTAVFPSLSASIASGDLNGFKDRLNAALRGVLFLGLPATVALILLGEPMIRLLFERGEWTAESTAATAWALSFFALGIPGFSLLEILSRAFYALEDTRTPVGIGVIAMVANIALSLVFMRVIGEPGNLSRGPFGGLALANALTTLVEALVLWWLLRRRVGELGSRVVYEGAARTAAAALVMGAALWLTLQAMAGYNALLTMIVGMLVGGVAFFGASLLLGIEEARSVPGMVLRRVRR